MGQKSFSYIFVDESGDPGKPFKNDESGKRVATGASEYYILSALPLTSQQLFAMEDRMIEIKNKFKYKRELKSSEIGLGLFRALLDILNEQNIKVFYRLVNKMTYGGKFAIDGNKRLHNVFDEYDLVKLVQFTAMKCNFLNSEVVIDRTDRRLLDGKFDNFDKYLMKKVNTKTIQRTNCITHVNSEYVNAMQITDLVSGAIKESFTKRNADLKKVINRKLVKIW